MTTVSKHRTESALYPRFRKTTETALSGRRTRHVITHYPNTMLPGHTLNIDLPKLHEESCLVPGSFNLLYKFNTVGSKSRFNNNLAAHLVEKLRVSIGGTTVYDNVQESLINLYKGLWLNATERQNAVDSGIANLNTRKLMCGEDTGASSGDAQKVEDGLMSDVFGDRQKICLSKILDNAGLYSPHSMNNNPRYEITLPAADKFMVASSGSAGYSISNIELEYETITNPTLAGVISSMYETGTVIDYEHVTCLGQELWSKSSVVQNMNINIPRHSMRAIVLLFTKESTPQDEDQFMYPLITKVEATIEGVPNMIFSRGMLKQDLYSEAKRVFSRGASMENGQYVSPQSFYNNHFALVVDLRVLQDTMKHGTGKVVRNTQSGVILKIIKDVGTADYWCNTFVISDGSLGIVNGNLGAVAPM